jgi:hypothetical protein
VGGCASFEMRGHTHKWKKWPILCYAGQLLMATWPIRQVVLYDQIFFFFSRLFRHIEKKKRAQSYKSGATPIADLVLMGCYYYQNRLTTAITRHIPMKSRYVTATGSCIQMGQCTDLFFQFTFKENGR